VIRTVKVQAILLDPLGYFDVIPEPIVEFMRLWASRLEPEMEPTDFMTSYYVLLEDVQKGDVKSWLTPCVKLHPWIFAIFPHLLPALLPREEAQRVHAIWVESLKALRCNEEG